MRLHTILLLALLALQPTPVYASTFTYSEALYGSLQGAVDAASPGDTLVLPEGLYEGPVTVDKPLTIIGSGEGTRLVTRSGLSTLTVIADSVRVSGVLFLVGNTGVVVEEADRATIEDCIFVENAVGVDIIGGVGHRIRGNRFINNVACGAILQEAWESTIEGNSFDFSQPEEWPDIRSIVGDGRGRIGLKLLRSGNLTVSGNTFKDVDRCIHMGGSRGSSLASNVFLNSTVGLSMQDSAFNVIDGNQANMTGELMSLWLSSYNNVTGNVIAGGPLSRDVESTNLYVFPDITLTGRNFILETGEPAMDPIFEPLSEALNITLLPDPVTDAAWVRIEVNSTETHGDALPGSVGLYDPSGVMLAKAETLDQRTVLEYDVAENKAMILAKKVDSVSPVAVVSGDATRIAGEEVSFDASGSSDNIGIVEYRWSLGDGLEAAGVRIAHAYQHPGVYTVRLRVADAAGNIAEDSLQITVLAREAEDEGPGPLVYIPTLVLLLAVAVYVVKKYFKGR